MPDSISLPSWPTDLPLTPLLDAYEESVPSLITNVTTGNKSMIVRKNATRSQTTMNASFNFSREQMVIFEDFFNSTLDGGSLRFTFTNPRTKKVISVSFSPTQSTAFTITPNGSMEYFKVPIQLIVWN